MLQQIRSILAQLINDIDTGNSNMTEEDEISVLRLLRKFNRRDRYMSKYQAYQYLGIGRSKFDSLVREGKIPPGHKIPGFKELHWKENEIKGLLPRSDAR